MIGHSMQKREQAKRDERSGRGQQGSTAVRQLPHGTVCRQQRTGQQEYQHPGKRQFALLACEPHVIDGHCYGQGRPDQGQWLDARPRSCRHASIITWPGPQHASWRTPRAGATRGKVSGLRFAGSRAARILG
jgi:hypothetical protein